MSDLVSYIKEANHTFVTDHAASGITELSKYPARKLAVLACMDARLLYLLEPALGLKRGDANIIKVAGNTAGRGFDSVIGSLMVAVYELHVEDILVIGHDDCGMLHTTSASLCEKMAAAGIPAAVIEELEPRLMAWADPVCDSEESVRVAVRQLQKNPYLPDTVRFHGAVIRPDTGDVRFIVENAEKSEADLVMSIVKERMADHAAVLAATESLIPDIEKAGALVRDALAQGHKLLFCGNGGSAADSQHLAAEIVGRFQKERCSLPAIALTVDTSVLTAVANDYGYDTVFSRQVEGLGQAGDILIGISTSGNSKNVVAAIELAKRKGLKVIGLTGAGGGKMAELCDICLAVPAQVTARIQEMHIMIGHILCEIAEEAY